MNSYQVIHGKSVPSPEKDGAPEMSTKSYVVRAPTPEIAVAKALEFWGDGIKGYKLLSADEV